MYWDDDEDNNDDDLDDRKDAPQLLNGEQLAMNEKFRFFHIENYEDGGI